MRAGWRIWVVLVAVVGVATACTHVVVGSAVRTAGGPKPGTVDVTLLDPGNYPTKPRAPLGVAATPAVGALLEAQRMADFVVGPWEVDPALTTAYPFAFSPGSMPLTATRVDAIALPEVAAAARAHGVVAGFATARQVTGQKDVFNIVLRMPDPAAAATAATDMAAATHDHPIGAGSFSCVAASGQKRTVPQ